MVTTNASSKKILHCANVCFSAHANAQPCGHTTREAFQALKGLCDIYTIVNLQCRKCARTIFHCANGLVALRVCAPQKGTLVATADGLTSDKQNNGPKRRAQLKNKNHHFKHVRCFQPVAANKTLVSNIPVLEIYAVCTLKARTSAKIMIFALLTNDFEKEAAMPPILAENDKVPMATFLIHVGKSSGEYK